MTLSINNHQFLNLAIIKELFLFLQYYLVGVNYLKNQHYEKAFPVNFFIHYIIFKNRSSMEQVINRTNEFNQSNKCR